MISELKKDSLQHQTEKATNQTVATRKRTFVCSLFAIFLE